MARPNTETNHLAFDNPEPGDHWHEMLCPYFTVLAVHGEGAARKLTVRLYVPFNEYHSGPVGEEGMVAIVPIDFMSVVRYGHDTRNGFVADVMRKRISEERATEILNLQKPIDLTKPQMELPKVEKRAVSDSELEVLEKLSTILTPDLINRLRRSGPTIPTDSIHTLTTARKKLQLVWRQLDVVDGKLSDQVPDPQLNSAELMALLTVLPK